jgi:hypothetical protein
MSKEWLGGSEGEAQEGKRSGGPSEVGNWIEDRRARRENGLDAGRRRRETHRCCKVRAISVFSPSVRLQNPLLATQPWIVDSILDYIL